MPQIDKRGQRYRARYYDPLGRRHSKTFVRKADAERFLRELRVEMDRGHWLDPKGAELTVAEWSEEFLQLARRLSPTTQATYPAGTSSATCCRASPPTASGDCPRMRSRTG